MMKTISSILLAAGVLGTSFMTHDSTEKISSVLTDQIGYRPGDKKIAFLTKNSDPAFSVVDVRSGKTVFTGSAGPVGLVDKSSGDLLFSIDISDLKKIGSYRIVLNDSSDMSSPFNIGNDVYDLPAVASLKSFYYQRCGTVISDNSIWTHPACHEHPARFLYAPNETKDVSGGWHDAGDYNKFVPTTAVSAAFLLYLYEYQSHKFTDGQLQIPECCNGIPDLLDEARWGLEWLMKMQMKGGGTSHKVSIKKWTDEHLPHEEHDPQYIFPVSSVSTADAAAVTALGSRLFREFDPEFSRRLLQSALISWEFLEQHPGIVPDGGAKNPDGIEGGEYGDTRDIDERLWAAVELFRATGEEKYERYMLDHYREAGGVNYTVSWQNVQNFAYYSYLAVPVTASNFQARSFIITTLSTYCDDLLSRIDVSGYRYVLTSDQYYWGSNSVAMGYAYDLIMGYRINGNPLYLEGALDQLHFILGRNTFGKSFVTGVGSNPVRHPYHQFTIMSKSRVPVPGMLVGGCNISSRLNGEIISKLPGRCYEDNAKNYFVNEPAINYTAPFVFVSSYVASMNTLKNQ